MRSRGWMITAISLLMATFAMSCSVATGQEAVDRAGEAPREAGRAAEGGGGAFRYFSFMTDDEYDLTERVALWVVLGVAVGGLAYAGALVGQVLRADRGTSRMRGAADAIRQGANAYLYRQFKAIVLLVFLLTAVLYFTAEASAAVKLGRAAAFFMGASFSWLVGFVGMSLAIRGNLRVAAAARRSYGEALQLGYRTGTVTGMLTDGLGLLGGTLIFMQGQR